MSSKPQATKFIVITLGDYGAGKTTFVKTYCHSDSNKDKDTFEYLVNTVTVDNKKYDIIVRDTQSMEDISYITSFYYNDASGVLFMVDLSNQNGLNNIDEWFHQAEIYYPNEPERKPIYFLIGTKTDLTQMVTDQQMEEVAGKFNMKYYKVSNTVESVVPVMDDLVTLMIQKTTNNKKRVSEAESSSGCCVLL